jgi:hypothetical protein
MVLHTNSEERLLVSRRKPRRQGENRILGRARDMAVYSHALWPLQRAGDFRKSNGDSTARSHARFVSSI